MKVIRTSRAKEKRDKSLADKEKDRVQQYWSTIYPSEYAEKMNEGETESRDEKK